MPAEKHQPLAFLAEMYARWTLDCLVEIAYAVSNDYFSSPEYYQGEDVPAEIVQLWMSYGSVKDFPDKGQRYILAAAILGESDASQAAQLKSKSTDTFHQSREPFLAACIARQTATAAQAFPGLDQQVVLALPTFRSYLTGFSGKAAQIAYQQLHAVSELSYRILRSDTVASRFIGKRNKQISENWPLREDDPSGSILIPEILSHLPVEGVATDLNFPVLRAMAQSGDAALQAVLHTPQPEDPVDLIRKAYSWAMFIQGYGRALK